MSHGLETLDQQSAPESTRGLFDTYNEKPKLPQASVSTDRHRSLDVTGRARQSLGPPPSTRNNNTTRNRSRSASTSDMGYFGNRRGNNTLQPLKEEGGQFQDMKTVANSKMISSLNGRESVTMDSLKDIINTLKTLPPTTSVSSSLSSSSTSGKNSNNNSKRYSHRKQASMSSLPFDQQHQQLNPRRSYNDNNSIDNMHSILLQNNGSIKEEESPSSTFDIKPSYSASRPTTISFRPRHSFGNHSNSHINSNNNGNHSNSGSDDDMGRDAALAEAEAKLVGSFHGPPSSSTSSTLINNNNNNGIMRPNRRRYSDSSSNPPLTLHKRTSLQQLATLNEESPSNGPLLQHHFTSSRSSSALSKRTQFNKPLDLFGNNGNNSDEKAKSLGHSRRSSRNMDMDWRTSLPAIPAQPTSPRSSFQLVPFTPTRVNFSRDDANPHQRRPLFIAHLPFSSLTSLFRSRQLVRGMLRVNKRNRSDAYVFCEELDADIYIAGSRDRNRALEGDVVAVRLVDVDKVLQEKREKEEAKLARNAGQIRTRLPDEEDENEIIFGGDEEVEIVKPKYCGVVVAILERAQNQLFSGTLTLIRPNNKRAQEEKDQLLNGSSVNKKEVPRIVWFKASDKRVPLIAIPIEQAPKDFVENSEKYATRLFAGSIKRWPITSLHPFGTLEKELGSVYDLSTQTSAIYADNNVTDSDFSEAVYNCLPPEPFEPSANDASTTSNRRDFTNVRCFTIDPKNSNVLDDAISIEKLDDDLYQIGVHISDVTYFIKPHSALDKEARTRGVRVDLLHSHVPMVPETMTENMTNLIPNHTRYTFSIVWKMNSHGKVSDTWYGKTLIRSCAQLTMEDVQSVVNGGTLENVPESYRSDVEKDVCLLNGIATELFNHRTQIGTLTQMKDELVFDFDTDYTPQHVSIVNKPITSHRIIKEFLLLANISVAQKISSRLPEQALLRRHASPNDRKIRALQQYCVKQLGVQIDIGSAGSLENSIQAIKDIKLRKLVSILVLKTLNTPKYFCAGTYDIAKYSHYALNVPLFTHFTAPSRRFSDIITHRQLEYALNNENDDNTPFYLDRDTVQKLAQHCNVKKEAARYAREQSSLLFLSNHINNMEKQIGKSAVYREATVVSVFDGYFDVMINELNMEKRIHLANLPVWRSDYNEAKQTLTMFWRKGVDTSTGKQRPWSLSDDEDDEDDGYLDEELLLEEMRQANLSDDDTQQQLLNESKESIDEINNNNNNYSNNNGSTDDDKNNIAEKSKDQSQSKDNHGNDENDKKNQNKGEVDLESAVKGLSILEKHGKNVNIPTNNNQDTTGPQPSLTVSRQQPESTKSTGKRASLVRARLSDSTAYSTEQGYQTIKALDKIRVVLVIDMVRTPPLIRILGVNPFA